jgi:hypothetical protein
MDVYTSRRHIDLTYTKKKPTRSEYHRDYNQKYREEHSNVIVCDCGGTFKQTSEYAHRKTKRHLLFSSPITNVDITGECIRQ